MLKTSLRVDGFDFEEFDSHIYLGPEVNVHHSLLHFEGPPDGANFAT